MPRLGRLAVLVLLACPLASAVTRQVGPAQTYATFSACMTAASSGDICNAHTATYTEQVTCKAGVVMRNNPGDTITLQSTSSPVVTVNSNCTISSDVVGRFNITYNGSGAAPAIINHTHGSNIDSVTLTNLVLTVAGGSGEGVGIYIADCDLCSITGTTVHVSSTTGAHDGANFYFNSHLTFTGNTIYGEPCSSATHLEDGIVASGTNLTFSNNLLHDGCSFDNHPDGIVIQGDGNRSGANTDTVTISANTIYNFTQGIYPDAIHASMTNILIYNNIVYETASYRYGGSAVQMNCVVLDGESLSGPSWNIQIGLYNNTLNCLQLHIYTLRLGAGTAITIKNNISLLTPFAGLNFSNNTGVTVDYDFFSQSDATPLNWGGSNVSRATFISNGYGEANSAAGTANLNADYSEKSVSPTRSIGAVLNATFCCDILGVTRGAAWDMGAFEFAGPFVYYIKNGGSDAASGLSDALAWATIAKVNAFACGLGDSFSFKRGSTWNLATDAALVPACSSTTYNAYDSGALPILDGMGTVSTAVNAAGKSSIVLDRLDIRRTTSYNVLFNGCSSCTVSNSALSSSAAHGINVVGVSPLCSLTGNTYGTSAAFDMAGKAFNVATTSGTCTISDNTIDLSDVLSTRNVSGIVCSASTTGCIVTNNTIIMDQGVQGIGIKSVSASGHVTGGQITGNSIVGLTNVCTGCDGEAIELTGGDASHRVQDTDVGYNYVKNGATTSADCIGLFWANANRITYNLCIGNSGQNAGIHITTQSQNNVFYNNDTYGSNYGFEFIGSTVTGNDVQNNIALGHQRGIGFFTSSTGTYSNNISYNNSIANYVGGTDGGNNLTSNPVLAVSPPTGSNDFKLQGSSPAINAGHNLGATFQLGLDPADSTFPYNRINQNSYGPGWEIGGFVFIPGAGTYIPRRR